jgi:hypothetical protein
MKIQDRRKIIDGLLWNAASKPVVLDIAITNEDFLIKSEDLTEG